MKPNTCQDFSIDSDCVECSPSLVKPEHTRTRNCTVATTIKKRNKPKRQQSKQNVWTSYRCAPPAFDEFNDNNDNDITLPLTVQNDDEPCLAKLHREVDDIEALISQLDMFSFSPNPNSHNNDDVHAQICPIQEPVHENEQNQDQETLIVEANNRLPEQEQEEQTTNTSITESNDDAQTCYSNSQSESIHEEQQEEQQVIAELLIDVCQRVQQQEQEDEEQTTIKLASYESKGNIQSCVSSQPGPVLEEQQVIAESGVCQQVKQEQQIETLEQKTEKTATESPQKQQPETTLLSMLKTTFNAPKNTKLIVNGRKVAVAIPRPVIAIVSFFNTIFDSY